MSSDIKQCPLILNNVLLISKRNVAHVVYFIVSSTVCSFLLRSQYKSRYKHKLHNQGMLVVHHAIKFAHVKVALNIKVFSHFTRL
jgi:hypothetical protein